MKNEPKPHNPNNIKYYRTKAGVTQKTLANELGVSRPTITQYENGTRNPSVAVWISMSQILNTTTDELMGANQVIR